MAAEWEMLARAAGFNVERGRIDLECAPGRFHRVTVADEGDAFIASAVVVRASRAPALTDLATVVWLRNRATNLVGFRFDRHRRLIGEAWIPKAGLDAEDFRLYLETVAAECDRFEYALTGKDRE